MRIVVLKLPLDVTERPELYDFLFRSGVVREDEGVEIFRGSMEGERDAERTSADNGGGFGKTGAGDCPWVWCNDSRFNRLVSVGLIVLAPRPVAWGSEGAPGITDIRFPTAGLELLAAALGDRGSAMEIWLFSSDRALVSGDSMDWLALGGGCTDLALELLEPEWARKKSPIGRDPPSTEDRVADSSPALSDSEAALGRRLRGSNSPPRPTSPVDFLGGLPTVVLETGG